MDISKKTDYSLRVLAALVKQSQGVLSVRSVADEYGIPYSFARAIQHDLANAGLITSTRGAHGGMMLNVDPKDVTLLSIVEAVQGPIHVSDCDNFSDGKPCTHRGECGFMPVWAETKLLLREWLSSVTLHDVLIEGVRPHVPERFVRQ